MMHGLTNLKLVKKTSRSDEAAFEVNYTENLCNWLYGCLGNWQICEDTAMNLSGLTVWCGMSTRGLIGPF